MFAGRNAGSKLVVLVDDDKFLLDIYQVKFQHRGYAAHAFPSAEDALRALRGGLAPSALVIDLELPGIDGFALLQILRDERLALDAARIVLTNKLGSEYEEKARQFGADRFVVKAAMLPNDVVSAVEDAIANKTIAAPS